MISRIDGVRERFEKGYNCAQAVACAYCDLFDIDEKEAFRSVECFGRGMSFLGPCGAVSAMAYLVGLKISDANLNNPQSKTDCYAAMEPLTNAFLQKNKSLECKDLKGIDTGIPLRTCLGCMEDAALLLEQHLLADL